MYKIARYSNSQQHMMLWLSVFLESQPLHMILYIWQEYNKKIWLPSGHFHCVFTLEGINNRASALSLLPFLWCVSVWNRYEACNNIKSFLILYIFGASVHGRGVILKRETLQSPHIMGSKPAASSDCFKLVSVLYYKVWYFLIHAADPASQHRPEHAVYVTLAICKLVSEFLVPWALQYSWDIGIWWMWLPVPIYCCWNQFTFRSDNCYYWRGRASAD